MDAIGRNGGVFDEWALEATEAESGSFPAASENFEWHIEGVAVAFARCHDGRWRMVEKFRNLVIVWLTADGWRASIGLERLIVLSKARASPHIALEECALWFRRRASLIPPAI